MSVKLRTASVQTLAGNGKCCVQDGPVGVSSLAYPHAIAVVPGSATELLVADNYPFGLRIVDDRHVATINFPSRPRLHIEVPAIAFHPSQPRLCFIADPSHNKIKRFNIDTREMNVFAGAVSGH